MKPMDLADAHIRTGPAYQVRARRRKSAEPRSMSACGAPRPLPNGPTKVRLLNRLPTLDLEGGDYSSCPRLFSNSGPGVKLSVNILAGSRVLSAVGTCPPHDGVG